MGDFLHARSRNISTKMAAGYVFPMAMATGFLCSGGGSTISEKSAFSLRLVRQPIVHATACGHVFAVVTQKDHCERGRVEEVAYCVVVVVQIASGK